MKRKPLGGEWLGNNGNDYNYRTGFSANGLEKFKLNTIRMNGTIINNNNYNKNRLNNNNNGLNNNGLNNNGLNNNGPNNIGLNNIGPNNNIGLAWFGGRRKRYTLRKSLRSKSKRTKRRSSSMKKRK